MRPAQRGRQTDTQTDGTGGKEEERRKDPQFMPQIPVTTFIGRTIVPKTVSLPRISEVFSCRSPMRILIWAR